MALTRFAGITSNIPALGSVIVQPPAGEEWALQSVVMPWFALLQNVPGWSGGNLTLQRMQVVAAGQIDHRSYWTSVMFNNTYYLSIFNQSSSQPSAAYYAGVKVTGMGMTAKALWGRTTTAFGNQLQIRPPVGKAWLVTHLEHGASGSLGVNGINWAVNGGGYIFPLPKLILTNSGYLTLQNNLGGAGTDIYCLYAVVEMDESRVNVAAGTGSVAAGSITYVQPPAGTVWAIHAISFNEMLNSGGIDLRMENTAATLSTYLVESTIGQNERLGYGQRILIEVGYRLRIYNATGGTRSFAYIREVRQ